MLDIRSEENRQKKEKILKNRKRYKGSVTISMSFKICVTEIPERRKKKKTIFLKIMAQNFSKINQWS